MKRLACLVGMLMCAGCQGPAGPQGDQGPIGDQGTPGAMGTMGDGGPEGPVGPQGPQGDAGPGGQDLRLVGPGLVVTIRGVSISDAGVAIADLTLTDDAGHGLDRLGRYTEGAVSVSLLLGFVTESANGMPLQYESYITRSVAFDGGTFIQNGTDSNGVWSEQPPAGSGQYRYTFGKSIDVGVNANKTHTVGLYATRAFTGTTFVSNALFDFRPDGQPATAKRDVATTAGCNSCHTRLEAHGGARREVGLCVMCHTAANDIDPETGNTIDFKKMIHGIHRGAGLPSVDAGTPYRFIGYMNSVHDFSDVEFPANINDCESCHTGSQGDRWKTFPSQNNCIGCHDRTWFENASPPAGFTVHSGGPRTDAQCIVCHDVTSIEPIDRRHPLPRRDPNRLEVTGQLVDVPATAPGTAPSITFSVNVNGQPRDVLSNRMSRLRFVFAGPNTDYERFWSISSENALDCASVTDGGVCLSRVDAGLFTVRTPVALAPTDHGSFSVGLEVCATSDAGVRWCGLNPVAPFAVTDATPHARRGSVTLAKCDSCHRELAHHGGTRTNTQQCVLCHNPNLVGAPDSVPVDGSSATGESLNFKDMIHRTHAEVAYPSPLNACSACHVAGALALPLAPMLLPSKSTLVSCTSDAGTTCATIDQSTLALFTFPTAAACSSCHASVPAQAHMALNTTPSGLESCAVCHATGKSEAFDAKHALAP